MKSMLVVCMPAAAGGGVSRLPGMSWDQKTMFPWLSPLHMNWCGLGDVAKPSYACARGGPGVRGQMRP